MRLHFKHEDTRLVILLVVVYVVIVLFAVWIATEAALYVVIGYVLVAVVMLEIDLYRRARIDAESDRMHLQDLLWLYRNGEFAAPLPPLTGWAAEPGLVGLLQSLVLREKPKVVVELGSGASTVVLGSALRQIGNGRVVSLEHDEAYAFRTMKDLEFHDLLDFVQVRHTPLGPVRIDGEEKIWYLDALSGIPRPVDLLVVDGPPFATTGMARFPALPMFYDRLSRNASVVLHDLYRQDEQRIVEEWMSRYSDFEVYYVETPKRAAVLRRIDGEKAAQEA